MIVVFISTHWIFSGLTAKTVPKLFDSAGKSDLLALAFLFISMAVVRLAHSATEVQYRCLKKKSQLKYLLYNHNFACKNVFCMNKQLLLNGSFTKDRGHLK